MKTATTIRSTIFRLLAYSRITLITTTTSLRRTPGRTLWATRSRPQPTTARHPSRAASAGEQALDQGQGEVDHEGERGRVHHRRDLAPAAPNELDEAVADEPGPDPIGDRVGERHHGQGEESRETLLEVV